MGKGNGGGGQVGARGALARWRGAIGALSGMGTALGIRLRLYPRAFDRDGERVEGILRGFATAVVPGVSPDDPHLTRAFRDRDLSPLTRYRGFLAADLCARAWRRFGTSRFEALDEADRTAVIQDGLDADPQSRRLYGGAIFLIQIACYAGIYHDEKGCPLIDYGGRFQEGVEIGYPNPEAFLARPRTADGNYA